MVGTNISAGYVLILLTYSRRTGAVSKLILLMVGTKHFRRLCAYSSYGSRRTGAVSRLMLLMVGINISPGYVLILLMAGELTRLGDSSFSWKEPTFPQVLCPSFSRKENFWWHLAPFFSNKRMLPLAVSSSFNYSRNFGLSFKWQ